MNTVTNGRSRQASQTTGRRARRGGRRTRLARLAAAVVAAIVAAPAAGQGFERVFDGNRAAGERPAGDAARGARLDLRSARLEPVRLYNGIERRLEIEVLIAREIDPAAEDDGPRTVRDLQDRIMPMTRRRIEEDRAARRRAAEAEPPHVPAALHLVLLDAGGAVIDRSVAVEPGPVDLARVMPDIWTLRSVAWLQLTADDEPIGTPLVIEPMLARVVPVARESVSPSGMRTTGIAEWVAEADAWDAALAAARGEAGPPPLPMDDGRLEVDDTDVTSPVIYGRPGATAEAGGLGSTFGETGASADGAGDASDDASDDATDGAVLVPSDRPLTRAELDAVRPCTGFRVYIDADVRLRTDRGDLLFALRPDAAPNTAWNFRHLVDGGFYRGVVFHRVVPLTAAGDPFVVQAGDPTATGNGGPGWWLPMEPSTLPHDFGVLSMARAAHPDSAGSQFFVCLSRPGTARLDGDYTSFGELIAGDDVLRAIAAVRLADVETGRPRNPPLIQEAFLEATGPRRIVDDGGSSDADATPGDSGRDRVGR